jgi:hypothetical protein
MIAKLAQDEKTSRDYSLPATFEERRKFATPCHYQNGM